MSGRAVYSPTAMHDLDRLWAEVFEVSQSYEIAEKYVFGLMDRVEAKAELPRSGSPLYYENGFTGYYFVVYKSYLAFYRVEDHGILIDRVLMAKSDYLRKLHLGLSETQSE